MKKELTEYQLLCKRVYLLDKNAAKYMRSKEIQQLDSFVKLDTLLKSFIWVETPQGHNYWKNLSDLAD